MLATRNFLSVGWNRKKMTKLTKPWPLSPMACNHHINKLVQYTCIQAWSYVATLACIALDFADYNYIEDSYGFDITR